MDSTSINEELERNRQNLKEALIIKLEAHRDYLVPRLKSKKEQAQVSLTFTQLVDCVAEGCTPDPDQMFRNNKFDVTHQESFKKVLDTYAEIYYNMFKRYFGRSDDFYLEKI